MTEDCAIVGFKEARVSESISPWLKLGYFGSEPFTATKRRLE